MIVAVIAASLLVELLLGRRLHE